MTGTLSTLIALSELTERERDRCSVLIDTGVLVCIDDDTDRYISTYQFDLLRRNGSFSPSIVNDEPLFSALFRTENEILVWPGTSVLSMPEASGNSGEPTGEVILQLLPHLVDGSTTEDSVSTLELPGGIHHIFSKNAKLIGAIKGISGRIEHSPPKSTGFARSAHYLGSKATLAPAIKEIIRTVLDTDGGTIIDLMCGSGAAAGAFAREWATYASDAQNFSRLLAKIQGGGFSEARARATLDKILPRFKSYYAEISARFSESLKQEEDFLTSELTDSVKEEFASWVSRYPSLRNPDPQILHEISERRAHQSSAPGVLFSFYYANVFFGVRQCAEIDGLRSAIELIENQEERDWALGALICTVSACADNYGGHFAQPRLRLSDPADIAKKIEKTLLKRSLSITQEFAIRLMSLGSESSKTRHPVKTVEGPWEAALSRLSEISGGAPAAVYLDPPYTRDEYSRYYHVLETLVLYNYPRVSGPALVPEKGSLNRFSSEFFSRTAETVGDRIAAVIRKCLENNWPVLLSYADTGLASMLDIIRRVDKNAGSICLYRTAYKHVMHGRKGVKHVNEFVILIQPKAPI